MKAATRQQLGTQLIEHLRTYEAGFAKYAAHTPVNSSDQWHREHQKDIQAMIALIKNDADLTVDDDSGATVLFLARQFLCDSDSLFNELLELLVTYGASHRDRFGNTLDVDVCGLKKLIRFGLRFTQFDDQLIINAASEPSEKMELLLSAGGNPEAVRSQDGPTALMIAVAHNNLMAVRALVRHLDSVKVNQRYDYTGTTALHYACDDMTENLNHQYLLDKYAIIELLINKGGNINAQDHTGATPLIHAIKSQDSHDIPPEQQLIDLVIARGADVLMKDNNRLSALHYASHKELTKLNQALLFAVARYQPQNLEEAERHTQVDIDVLLKTVRRYDTFKHYIVRTFDFARYLAALFGVIQAIMICKQRAKVAGRSA